MLTLSMRYLSIAFLSWLTAQQANRTLLLELITAQGYTLDTLTIQRMMGLVSERELMSHLSFLASDALQGREAGTPHEKIAATYLMAHHQRWGHTPLLPAGYFHPFPLRRVRPNSSIQYPKPPKKKGTTITPTQSHFDTVIAWNVLALRRGTETPSQYVILSAHYDHLGTNEKGQVYNGADDNGSGTAVLLEAARLLSLLPSPRRSIIFFHTGAEEKGLVGAFRFVRDSLVPIDSIIAVLNVDMLGRTDTAHQPGETYLYAIGPNYTTPRLRELHEAINNLCCQWQFDYRYDDKSHPERLFYRSDHYAFAQKGVPALFYFGGLHEDYHRTSDDIEKIEPERLRRAAALLAALAWTMANL